MKFSVQKRRITIDHPVMQMGYAARDHMSEGIHDDCYATLVWIEDREPLLIACFDLLGGTESFAAGIRKAISTAVGIDGNRVLVCYSHTHGFVHTIGEDDLAPGAGITVSLSAPQNHDVDFPDLTADLAYARTLFTLAGEMAAACRDSLISGRIVHRRTSSRFGISRRKTLPDGTTVMAPNDDDSLMDDTVDILSLEDTSGELHALLWNYACHPTTCASENYLITADYPGGVRRALEAAYPGVIPVFLQGCGADVRPRATCDGAHFRSFTPEEMTEASKTLAADITAALAGPGRVLDVSLACLFDPIRLYAEDRDRAWWQALADNEEEHDYRRQSARVALRRMDAGQLRSYLPYPMRCFRLDAKTCLFAIPNEVVSDYGKRIRALFPGLTVIIVSYAEYVTTYIPTRNVLENGGYEAESFLDAGITGPFVPEIEDIIAGHAADMILRAVQSD